MITRFFITLFLGCVLVPNGLKAGIYYVDNQAPGASDASSGAATAPWKTIQHAADSVHPGDTVYIKAGVYQENVLIKTSGASNAWITFSAFPGQELQAVLDRGSINISKASYISVSGLKIANATNSASGNSGIVIVGPGGNYSIRGNYTSNTASSGIAVWGMAYAGVAGTATDPSTVGYRAVTNVLIADNTIDRACNGGYNEQLTIANGVDTIEIRSNILKNAPDDPFGGEGIDLKEGVSNARIWGNHIFNNVKYGIYLEAGASSPAYYQTPGVNSNILVYNNVIHDLGNHGIGITSEGRGSTDGVNIFNNIIYNNGSDGILLYDFGKTNNYCGNITIINNTLYNNATLYHSYGGIHLNHSHATNVIVRNNIVWSNNAAAGSGAWQIWNQTSNTNVVMDRNVLGPTSLSMGTGAVPGQNLNGSNPRLANPAAGNFQLLSNSPAIGYASSNLAPAFDAELRARPGNGSWDSGALEYDPVPTLVLSAVTANNGSLRPALTLHGSEGTHYQLQWSPNLAATNWYLLRDIPALGGTSVTITDAAPISVVPARFYRVLAP